MIRYRCKLMQYNLAERFIFNVKLFSGRSGSHKTLLFFSMNQKIVHSSCPLLTVSCAVRECSESLRIVEFGSEFIQEGIIQSPPHSVSLVGPAYCHREQGICGRISVKFRLMIGIYRVGRDILPIFESPQNLIGMRYRDHFYLRMFDSEV